jgi:phosphoglucosamine mutase
MVTSPIKTQLSNISDSSLNLKRHRVAALGSPIDLPTTRLFGTDGIRGQVGELLNSALAFQVGFFAGRLLQAAATHTGPVIIGQDSRNSSEMLATALADGLTTAGVEVWDLGLCPTAGVAYLTSVTGAVGGAMISASHNPPEDNGIKFFDADGMKLSTQLQDELETALRSNTQAIERAEVGGKSYERPELVADYVKSLRHPLEADMDLRGMKIVLDLAWGASVQVAPEVFANLGAEVICLHDRADGNRINVNCGSTHLEALQAAVKLHDADIGFAFDGDADRVMAVDAKGRVVDGDYILYFWGKTLRRMAQLPHDLIVSTVMANLGFERAWKEIGGKLVRTSVGDQYVQAEMLRMGGMLGGEQSGHILCRHYGITGDGILTALHLANLVRESGVCLSSMLGNSFQTYPQILKNVRVEDRDRRVNWQNCEGLMKAIAQAEAVMGDRGRILVRASGTEPLIRVMVEAADLELTHQWADRLVLAVEKYLK